MVEATYVLPIRSAAPPSKELTDYLRMLSGPMEVIVVDGSAPSRFRDNHREWATFATHVAPDADLRYRNGKVNGVVTGLRRATHHKIVVADDDVRYDQASLARVLQLLDE